MTSTPALRRWLSLAATGAVLAAALGGLAYQRQAADAQTRAGAAKAEAGKRSWPLWGGSVQRNLVNLVEQNIATDWSVAKGKEKNIKWSQPLGSKAYGGPIIAGGKIFIGTNNQRPRNKAVHGDKGILMCFRESDGTFLWQAIHDKLPAGRVNDWPEEGICSSPVVEGKRLWYVSNRCEVVCADVEGLADGNQGEQTEKYTTKLDADFLWRLDMIKDLNVFPHNLATCSPLIVGDTVFVITSNGVDENHLRIPSPGAPSFLAVNKNTGKVIWSSKAPGRNIMHGQWSNPVYAEAKGRAQIIFPGGDGYIYSFDPKDGTLLWKFDCNPKSAKYLLGGKGTRNDFVCTPVIWENKLYIGVGQDPEHKKGVGHLWCIDITKTPKNKDKDISPYSSPKDPNPKFDPKDPKNKDSGLVWHYGGAKAGGGYLFGRTLSTCCVHEGLCYACDFDGVFRCFDANTGKKLWEFDMQTDTWSSPYFVGGNVYMGNEDGVMHIFKHGKTEPKPKTINMRGKLRATPVAVNGVLYVITENPTYLWAITK
jgi:outer membrane protein assembly factor BamB